MLLLFIYCCLGGWVGERGGGWSEKFKTEKKTDRIDRRKKKYFYHAG